jgi:hypothetical protein
MWVQFRKTGYRYFFRQFFYQLKISTSVSLFMNLTTDKVNVLTGGGVCGGQAKDFQTGKGKAEIHAEGQETGRPGKRINGLI